MRFLRAPIPRLRRGTGARFRASGRDLSCAACGFDRFWTSRGPWFGLGLWLFPMRDVLELTCEACAHIMKFQEDAPLEALD